MEATSPEPPRIDTETHDYAFIFTGGGFGTSARAYIRAFYPEHHLQRATSFENMFHVLARDIQRREAGDRRRVEVGEIILVTHANEAGQIGIPVTEAQRRRLRRLDSVPLLTESLPELQEDFRAGRHGGFRGDRRAALESFTGRTRIVIRGCNFGDARAGMDALRDFFGGGVSLLAPRAFQGFETLRIGGRLLPDEVAAYDFLVRQGYIPASVEELTREQKRETVLQMFPNRIVPAEFFVMDRAAHEAFDRLPVSQQLGPEAEPFIIRPDEMPEVLNPLYPSGDDRYWARTDGPIMGRDAQFDRLTVEQIDDYARRLIHPYEARNAATLLRLRSAWERKTLDRALDPAFGSGDPLAGLPPESIFGDSNILAGDAARFPGPTMLYDVFEEDTMRRPAAPVPPVSAAVEPPGEETPATAEAGATSASESIVFSEEEALVVGASARDAGADYVFEDEHITVERPSARNPGIVTRMTVAELRSLETADLLAEARRLDGLVLGPARSAELATGAQVAVIETLLRIYDILDRRVQRAGTGADGLPQVEGIVWEAGSPLAGLLLDVAPFGNRDLWVALRSRLPRLRRAPGTRRRLGGRAGPTRTAGRTESSSGPMVVDVPSPGGSDFGGFAIAGSTAERPVGAEFSFRSDRFRWAHSFNPPRPLGRYGYLTEAKTELTLGFEFNGPLQLDAGSEGVFARYNIQLHEFSSGFLRGSTLSLVPRAGRGSGGGASLGAALKLQTPGGYEAQFAVHLLDDGTPLVGELEFTVPMRELLGTLGIDFVGNFERAVQQAFGLAALPRILSAKVGAKVRPNAVNILTDLGLRAAATHTARTVVVEAVAAEGLGTAGATEIGGGGLASFLTFDAILATGFVAVGVGVVLGTVGSLQVADDIPRYQDRFARAVAGFANDFNDGMHGSGSGSAGAQAAERYIQRVVRERGVTREQVLAVTRSRNYFWETVTAILPEARRQTVQRWRDEHWFDTYPNMGYGRRRLEDSLGALTNLIERYRR